MNRLQKARFFIDRAEATIIGHESTTLGTQLAIANALIALAERMDRVFETEELEQERYERGQQNDNSF